MGTTAHRTTNISFSRKRLETAVGTGEPELVAPDQALFLYDGDDQQK